MGLFSFVKNAGKKIFGRDDEPEPKGAEEAADFAVQLKERINGMGLGVEKLGIRWNEGGTVTVRGEATDQATREKIVLIVGNTAGVSQVDDQMTLAPPPQPEGADLSSDDVLVGPPAPEATFYTVQDGDTLSDIAKQHYGDALLYGRIFEANRPMLESPDAIYPGQTLRIPEAAPPGTYTVEKGDTLSKIAKKLLGDAGRYTEIYDLNKDALTSPDAIQVGQVLKIPSGANA